VAGAKTFLGHICGLPVQSAMDSPRKHRQQHAKEEQARLLQEHKEEVRKASGLLRKACSDGDQAAVLTHASAMLDELRTGSLTPKVCVRARVCVLHCCRAALWLGSCHPVHPLTKLNSPLPYTTF
jgi:hypothetical protein